MTTDSHYLTSKNLLEAMEGRSTTGKWDILVSYKAVQLSGLLAEVWNKDRKTDKLKVEDPKIRFGSKCSYDLDLGSPKLAFTGSDTGCMASLEIPLSGKVSVQLYTENDDGTYPAKPYKIKSQDIVPDSHVLKLTVPVKSVRGDVKLEDLDQKAQPAQSIVTLGGGQTDEAHVVLHFSSDQAVYSVETVPSTSSTTAATSTALTAAPIKSSATTTPAATNLLNDATAAIQKWFSNKENVNTILYRLATVKAIQDPSDASALLKPKSFVFGSNGDVLCIYIQTQGSGAEPGDTEAKFTNKDGSTIRPIPDGSTASIIIAHRLLHEKVFLYQLQKYQDSNKVASTKKITTSGNSKGFTYQFYIKGDFDVDMKGESGIFSQVYVPTTTVHMDDAPTTLKIEDTQASFDYNKVYPITWVSSSMSFGPSRPTENTADLTVKISQTAQAVKIEKNKEIIVDLSIDKNSFTLDKKSTSGAVALYEGVKNAKIEFNAVTIKSPNLNFIAAQSVLAPGATIVNVDSINIPYDLILIGKMVDHIIV